MSNCKKMFSCADVSYQEQAAGGASKYYAQPYHADNWQEIEQHVFDEMSRKSAAQAQRHNRGDFSQDALPASPAPSAPAAARPAEA